MATHASDVCVLYVKTKNKKNCHASVIPSKVETNVSIGKLGVTLALYPVR